MHVDVLHQAFLGEQHRLLCRAADADAEHARRTPAGSHRRHRLQYPVHQRVARIHHDELALVLAAAALGRDLHVDGVARHDGHVDDRRRVVLGVLALEVRVGHDACAQLVLGVEIAASNTFVDSVFDSGGKALEAHVHADFQEHVNDAGVLTDRAATFGAHLRVRENLRDRVLRRGAALAFVSAREVRDVVGRVVVADVLQGGSDAVDEVGVADGGHRTLGLKKCRTRARYCAALLARSLLNRTANPCTH